MSEIKLPHMPLWVYDIDTDRDCRAMDDATFGRYLRLLVRQWIEGSIPNDLDQVIRDGMLDAQQRDELRALLDLKFPEKDGVRINERCHKEREEALAKCRKNRRSGKLGGRPRKTERLSDKNRTVNRTVSSGKPNGSIRASGSESLLSSLDSSSGEEEEGTVHQGAADQEEQSRSKGNGHVNPLWDAVCQAFELHPVTKNEKSRIGRIVRDLKQKEAAPAEVADRITAYHAKMPPGTICTPEALLKHWDTLAMKPRIVNSILDT